MISLDVLKISQKWGKTPRGAKSKALWFAELPTDEEGGGNPKKVTQCKRCQLGGRRANPLRQHNPMRLQLGRNPAILVSIRDFSDHLATTIFHYDCCVAILLPCDGCTRDCLLAFAHT